MWVGGQRNVPAALPPGKTRYPLYRELGGPQGRFGQVWKISSSPPPGFDSRTVQPVASRYTDWAIPAHRLWEYKDEFRNFIYCIILDGNKAGRRITIKRIRKRKMIRRRMKIIRTHQSSSVCRIAGLPPCNYVNNPFLHKLCTPRGAITSLIFLFSVINWAMAAVTCNTPRC